MKEKKNIVIIGAGFAGVRTALDLIRFKSRIKNYRIVLIDRESFHTFTPWLYERATTGTRAEAVKIPLHIIFDNKPVELIKGEVVRINNKNNELYLKSGQKISFSALVLAYGSKTSDFGIKGIKKYALMLKTYDDAEKIRNTIEEKFNNFINTKERSEIFEIVIGGGGFTGIEFSAELHNHMKDLARRWERDEGSFEIKIIEGGDSLMKAGGIWASREVKKRLGAYRRIVVLLQSRIAEVSQGHLILTNGDVDQFDVLIWTGGVEGADLAHDCGMEISQPKCRIKADTNLRQKGFDNVFVAGDCAEIVDPITKKTTKEVIVDAYRAGALAAKNVVHFLNSEPLENFIHQDYGFVVPIRGRWGVSTVYGLNLKGRFAWFLARLIHLRYFFSILPLWQALKRWQSEVK